MYMLDFVQILQFLFVLFLAFFLVYTAVRQFKLAGTYIKHSSEKPASFAVVRYMRKLRLVDYECYHKLQIWRFYLFS